MQESRIEGLDGKLIADAQKERAGRPYLCWDDIYDPAHPAELGVPPAGDEPGWARPLQVFAKRLEWGE